MNRATRRREQKLARNGQREAQAAGEPWAGAKARQEQPQFELTMRRMTNSAASSAGLVQPSGTNGYDGNCAFGNVQTVDDFLEAALAARARGATVEMFGMNPDGTEWTAPL